MVSMSQSVERSLERASAMAQATAKSSASSPSAAGTRWWGTPGGHGMAEAASWLPIDLGTIRCPFARNPVLI
jgi:hypothetical protein